MDVATVKNQIMTKNLQKLYIFTGVEWKVQRLYIEQISKVSNKQLQYVDSLKDIYSKLINNSSFISKSYTYVIRDDKDFINEEKLQSQLSSLPTDNIIILLYTSVDKRTKFYKQYKDIIVYFEALKPAILKKYIQKELPLSDQNCDKLMEVCEYDYGRCLLEIDKVKNYHDGNKLPMNGYYDGEFEDLLRTGIIYQPPKDAIFDFVDAILDHKINLSFNLLSQCYAVNEATMVMISVLYTNAKAVLQVQSCDSKDVGKSTGLTGFQIMNAKKHVGKYRNGELLRIIDYCQRCQQGIISGTIEEEFVMDYLLSNIF